jgi:hypothetical protein
MNEHRRWTQTHITELRDRLQLGQALADIAKSLERTPEDITAMMRRLRLRLTAAPGV